MTTVDPTAIHLYRPPPDSHKGRNGKLLVIGGSKLFHSSIFWSADVASRIVDLVHFTSPANENNDVVRKRIKEGFWSGIVVDWGDVEQYLEEDDCVLIGPGMVRDDSREDSDIIFSRVARRHQDASSAQEPSGSLSDRPLKSLEIRSDMELTDGQFPRKKTSSSSLSAWGEEDKTKEIVDYLLKKYPTKRWVIDGGALQMVEPELVTGSCILTPHRKEFQRLTDKIHFSEHSENSESRISSENQRSRKSENPVLRLSDNQILRSSEFSECSELSKKLKHCTILLKGPTDIVCQGVRCIKISAGNPGMTKGGTGDVLAGLVAALYCKNDAWTAASVGSLVNKTAGDELYKRVGPYFNAADLLAEIPRVLAWYRGG